MSALTWGPDCLSSGQAVLQAVLCVRRHRRVLARYLLAAAPLVLVLWAQSALLGLPVSDFATTSAAEIKNMFATWLSILLVLYMLCAGLAHLAVSVVEAAITLLLWALERSVRLMSR